MTAAAPNRKPMYIALSILGVVLAGVVLLALFRSRQGGEVVPPPRSVSFDEAPSAAAPLNEQTVTIAPDQVERIGLKTETVGETMSGEAAELAATGVVEPNAYSETPVISLVGGVVRRVGAELGERVGKGQTVAVIFSDELAAAQSRYLSLLTESLTARQNYDRAARLRQLNPESRAAQDEADARLKTRQAELDEAQRRYNRTIKLVEIGASSREELEQDRTKLKTAEADLEQARRQAMRTAELTRLNPTGSRELEEAAVKLRTAEAELGAARERLILLGFSAQRVAALRSPSQISSEIALAAPVAGTVTARAVNQGEIVEANKELLKITNLSSVWVVAQVYEKDLGRMRAGTGASVTSDAFPGRLFRGRVTYIDPNINTATRTAQARVELENPSEILRLGMYVNVTFGALGTSERTVPTVPASAVQNMNNQKIVFTTTAEPNVFVMKTVRLGAETGGQVTVLEGLTVGERVVTDGSFMLRAELVKQNPSPPN